MASISRGPAVAKSLYRSLLRAHARHLPDEMRQLGDAYIKAEFRLHRNAKPEQADQFFTEWGNYLDQLLMTARAQETIATGSLDTQPKTNQSVFSFGKDLPQNVDFSEEQKAQLTKLRDEATNPDK